MRFMMMMIPKVYQPDTGGREAGEGFAPPAEAVAAMTKFNEELARAGALIAVDGLHPPSKARASRSSGGKPKVTDGPFTEVKEVIGGYWIIRVSVEGRSHRMGETLPAADGDVIEIRQVFELSDFPPDVQKAAENPTVSAQIETPKSP